MGQQWRRQDLMRGAQKLREIICREHVWKGNCTKSLSNFVQL